MITIIENEIYNKQFYIDTHTNSHTIQPREKNVISETDNSTVFCFCLLFVYFIFVRMHT